jgi:hypothetical protein
MSSDERDPPYAQTDRVQHARDLVSDGARRFRRVRVESEPRDELGQVLVCGVGADPHLTTLGHRVGRLADLHAPRGRRIG